LEHLFIERHYRLILKQLNIKKISVYNIDLTSTNIRLHMEEVENRNWHLLSQDIPYTSKFSPKEVQMFYTYVNKVKKIKN